MSSIRTDPVALDSNEYIFAIRGDAAFPSCEQLLFEHLETLRVFVPQQVIAEVHRNLRREELQSFYELLETAGDLIWDYGIPPAELVRAYESQGAKKGDAVIAAHLHAAGIGWLISENRHFLAEIRDLPFEVLNSVDALGRL